MTLLLATLIGGSPAWAFAEDTCYQDGQLANCYRLPGCEPGVETAGCGLLAIAQTAQAIGHGRSMFHFDATFYLAQAVGLDRETAYFAAAYDQATDLGQYVPVDRTGTPLVDPDACGSETAPDDCRWVTAIVDGVERSNLATGGYTLHFIAPHNPVGNELIDGIDGKAPDVHDALHEATLAQLRDWAFGAPSYCVAGLTEGGACRGGTLQGRFPVLGFSEGVPLSAPLGEQILATTSEADILTSQIDLVVPAEQQDAARLGIYLHALQDRVSHSECGDASVLFDTEDGAALDFDQEECDQDSHALRHTWEVGHDQSALPPRHQTTEPALEVTYDELLAWAEDRGVKRTGAEAAKVHHVATVLAILELGQANARGQAFEAALLRAGLELPPGYEE